MAGTGAARGAVLVLAVACATAPARTARAQDGRCIDELTDAEARSRLEHIEEVLEGDETQARWWWYGWLAFHAVTTAGQITLATVGDCDLGVVECSRGKDRASDIAGAIGGGVSMLTMLAMPFSPAYAGNRLDRMPERTSAELRVKLAEAERRFHAAAEDERRWTAPRQHAVLLGWMLGNGLVLPLAFDETTDAAVLVGGSLVIAEARLLTVPTDVAVAWDRYVHTNNPCMAPHLRPDEPAVQLGLTTVPGGLGLSLRF